MLLRPNDRCRRCRDSGPKRSLSAHTWPPLELSTCRGIQHSGGSPISANTQAYFELKNWLDNGANRDGIAPEAVSHQGIGQCNDAIPTANNWWMGVDVNSTSYKDFVANIEPFLVTSCAYGTCHSSPQADMYLTCGQTGSDPTNESKFNYAQVAGFVIQGGVPLSGTVAPAGNKNAALPLLACALLTDEPVILHNVPRIRDTEALLELDGPEAARHALGRALDEAVMRRDDTDAKAVSS